MNQEPEPANNRASAVHPRGKVLGGSSSINMMAYVRGNHGDYDRWRQKGNGWMVVRRRAPISSELEAFQDGDDPYHGSDGPGNPHNGCPVDPIFDSFFDAIEQAGYKKVSDYNGASQEGFARLQVNAVNGRRQSAAVAYLRPAMQRPNVDVQVRAHVNRVVIESGRAVGIEYMKDGKTHSVRAEKEVILAGGAINSPQVLMLSGIGPGGHLSEMGIDVVQDLPGVGEDLQDHPAIGLGHTYREQFSVSPRPSALTG